MPDVDEIRMACVELLSRRPAQHPSALAKRIGITDAAVIAALGSDYRFQRVAGAGCWHWSLRGPATKAARLRHDSAVTAANHAGRDAAIAVDRQRSQWRDRVRQVIAQHSGGATTRRIVDVARLAPAEVEAALHDLVRRGEIVAVLVAYMAEFGPFWKAA